MQKDFFSIEVLVENLKKEKQQDSQQRSRLNAEYENIQAYLANEPEKRFMADCIKRMKHRAWVIKGMLDRGFKQSDLEQIVNQYERIGMEPSPNYLCAQLYKFGTKPDDLCRALDNCSKIKKDQ